MVQDFTDFSRAYEALEALEANYDLAMFEGGEFFVLSVESYDSEAQAQAVCDFLDPFIRKHAVKIGGSALSLPDKEPIFAPVYHNGQLQIVTSLDLEMGIDFVPVNAAVQQIEGRQVFDGIPPVEYKM